MRYALISDIHGNRHALDVIIEDIKKRMPDRIICLGDLVGYGVFPNEVIDEVRDLADIVLAGNHDHAAVSLADITVFNQYANKSALWTRMQLTDENFTFLKSRPYTHLEDDLYFVHASPMMPEKWFYIFSDIDAEQAMSYSPAPIAFVGHTHIPFDRTTSSGRLINVGSVGQPRDFDPRAAYTLFDSESSTRELIRLEYDFKAAGKAIRKNGLPKFLSDRLKVGR